MFPDPLSPMLVAMQIQLHLENVDPPAGRATRPRASSVPFIGWLELLSAIRTLVSGEMRIDDVESIAAGRTEPQRGEGHVR